MLDRHPRDNLKRMKIKIIRLSLEEMSERIRFRVLLGDIKTRTAVQIDMSPLEILLETTRKLRWPI